MWQRKDILGLEELSAQEIEMVMNQASIFKKIFAKPERKLTLLKGKTVVILFFEPSTRTRTSFETAGKWLGADVINISVAASSVQKGESLRDTAKTLQAMGADIIIIRHTAAGSPHILASALQAKVINAGDGAHEHPTQGLLDLYTIREKKNSIKDLNVTIIGDILHSRVARSNIWGLRKMGANITVAGPPTLIPAGVEKMGVRILHDLKESLKDADVVNILRIQLERQEKGMFPSLREYSHLFGLNHTKLKEWAKPDILVLHPGPANLGVEISEEVSSGESSVIIEQVKNGVAVRMALLSLLAGGEMKNDAID